MAHRLDARACVPARMEGLTPRRQRWRRLPRHPACWSGAAVRLRPVSKVVCQKPARRAFEVQNNSIPHDLEHKVHEYLFHRHLPRSKIEMSISTDTRPSFGCGLSLIRINELFRITNTFFTAKGSSYLFLVVTLHGPSFRRVQDLHEIKHDGYRVGVVEADAGCPAPAIIRRALRQQRSPQ